MEENTLSMAFRALRIQISTGGTGIPADHILAGHPAAVTPTNGNNPDVSIYFFRVYHACQSGNVRTYESLKTIVQCIITPMAKGTPNNNISTGEEDLRILGQVMKCMHGDPRLIVKDENQNEACRVEIIPLELTVDMLSKIVPQQPQGGVRPTTAYELAVLPLKSKKDPPVEKKVKIVTYGVSPDMKDEDTFHQQYIKTLMKPLPGDNGNWKPLVYFIDEQGQQKLFQQVWAYEKTTELKFLVLGPEAGTNLSDGEKELTLFVSYWSHKTIKFESKTNKDIILSDPVSGLNYYHKEITWELDASFTGQYLFRIERKPADPDKGAGNVCLAVILRGDSA